MDNKVEFRLLICLADFFSLAPRKFETFSMVPTHQNRVENWFSINFFESPLRPRGRDFANDLSFDMNDRYLVIT